MSFLQKYHKGIGISFLFSSSEGYLVQIVEIPKSDSEHGEPQKKGFLDEEAADVPKIEDIFQLKASKDCSHNEDAMDMSENEKTG